MKIIYQEKETETSAGDLAGVLREQGLDGRGVIIELNDRIVNPGTENLTELSINSGDRINIFRIVAGG